MMRKVAGLMAVGLWCLLALPVMAVDTKTPPKAEESASAAKEKANAAPTAADAGMTRTAPVVPTATTAASTPIGGDAAAIDPTQCVIAPTGSSAEVQELRKQIQELQQQIAQQPAPEAKDYMIRTKNLPAGNYRERCFACMTLPDEDGNRVLSCTCPVGNSGFERPMLTLNECAADEEISLCEGTLVCGKCQMSINVNSNQISPAPGSSQTNTEKLDKFLSKKK